MKFKFTYSKGWQLVSVIDIFPVNIHTFCVHGRNVLRFLWLETCHLVVSGGSHFWLTHLKVGWGGGGEGSRIPNSSPPKIKRTFPKGKVDYSTNRVRKFSQMIILWLYGWIPDIVCTAYLREHYLKDLLSTVPQVSDLYAFVEIRKETGREIPETLNFSKI